MDWTQQTDVMEAIDQQAKPGPKSKTKGPELYLIGRPPWPTKARISYAALDDLIAEGQTIGLRMEHLAARVCLTWYFTDGRAVLYVGPLKHVKRQMQSTIAADGTPVQVNAPFATIKA